MKMNRISNLKWKEILYALVPIYISGDAAAEQPELLKRMRCTAPRRVSTKNSLSAPQCRIYPPFLGLYSVELPVFAGV